MNMEIMNALESEELKDSIIKDIERETIRSKKMARQIIENHDESLETQGFITDEQKALKIKMNVSKSLDLALKLLRRTYKDEFGIEINGRLTLEQEKQVLQMIPRFVQELASYEKIKDDFKPENKLDKEHEINLIRHIQNLGRKINLLNGMLRDYGPSSYIENDIAQAKKRLIESRKQLKAYIILLNQRSANGEIDIEKEKDNINNLEGKVRSCMYELKSVDYENLEIWNQRVQNIAGFNPNTMWINNLQLEEEARDQYLFSNTTKANERVIKGIENNNEVAIKQKIRETKEHIDVLSGMIEAFEPLFSSLQEELKSASLERREEILETFNLDAIDKNKILLSQLQQELDGYYSSLLQLK